MTIDWFTFVAQMVNFLVLVVLLRRFLYRPILEAMAKREESIAAQFKDAAQLRQEAEHQQQTYAQKQQELEDRRHALIKAAEHQAEQTQQEILQQARVDVQRKRQEWLDALQQEQQEVLSELRRQVGHLGVEAARKALAQIAEVPLEEQTIASFLRHLQQIGEEQRQPITQHLNYGQTSILVRTAFDVSEHWQDRLRASLLECFGHAEDLVFATAPELILGIELEVAGYRLGWNLADVLRSIEQEFGERLKTMTKAGVR